MSRLHFQAYLSWALSAAGALLSCGLSLGGVSLTRGLFRAACRDLVPLGQLKSNFNYNLDDKRVLNFENVVNDDDNIKQVNK